MPVQRVDQSRISVVITAHDEGVEVRRTIDSIRAMSEASYEIILVDDGSTDGCCEHNGLGNDVRLIRHDRRIGVAFSRYEASQLAQGQVIAYLDAHQRVEGDSLERCAELALAKHAIVCPDVCGLDDEIRIHGAYFVQCHRTNLFSAEWKYRKPQGEIARLSSLRAPAYLVPRSIYPIVGWSPLLRGWGGSEAAISLKAFFAGVEILHLCGPLIRHQFKRKFHYDVGWPEVWRNHALTARVCFDERTWYDYWLPEVFEPCLSDAVQTELESEAIKAEHARFARVKVRHDRDFWTRLAFRNLPDVLR